MPGTQVTYTASAPGEPPAVQTGQLRNSVTAVVENEGKSVKGIVAKLKEREEELARFQAQTLISIATKREVHQE